MVKDVACPDCDARFPERDGPTHAYVGGSAGCWAAFGQLSQLELDLGIPGPSRLSVHTYMAQHPGSAGRRAAQSVGVHLMVLGSVLERGFTPGDGTAGMVGWLRGLPTFPWLTPPGQAAAITIGDLDPGADRVRHEADVRSWAEAVWSSWVDHHAVIRTWLDDGRPGPVGGPPRPQGRNP